MRKIRVAGQTLTTLILKILILICPDGKVSTCPKNFGLRPIVKLKLLKWHSPAEKILRCV